MLWVYSHYKYFYSYSAVIEFRRQILTSKVDPRAVSAHLCPATHICSLYRYTI